MPLTENIYRKRVKVVTFNCLICRQIYPPICKRRAEYQLKMLENIVFIFKHLSGRLQFKIHNLINFPDGGNFKTQTIHSTILMRSTTDVEVFNIQSTDVKPELALSNCHLNYKGISKLRFYCHDAMQLILVCF